MREPLCLNSEDRGREGERDMSSMHCSSETCQRVAAEAAAAAAAAAVAAAAARAAVAAAAAPAAPAAVAVALAVASDASQCSGARDVSSRRCETVRSSRHRLGRFGRSCCRWARGSVRCCASRRASRRSGQHRAWPQRKRPPALDPSPRLAQIPSARRRTCSASAAESCPASSWAVGVAVVSPWAPATWATPRAAQ